MPDITMCQEKDCPKAETCYRFMATPTPGYQSYFLEMTYTNEGCSHYWPVKSKSEYRRLEIQTKD